MSKQPLHEVADALYVVECGLKHLLTMLDEGKIVTVIKSIEKMKKAIYDAQFEVREKAIKEEGEKKI